ncbi:efflux RND transporter permease subunit [Kineosporia rhizophila]|uniref:efflux RND transporter permease subunit n=1 Tax=Kineosporia rhizophila TaxID=84633 RepID=UPI001E5D15FB|nr:efflux RND transporter permease subunit [Kineosporia rhizophila]MCE0539726.1 efflux RND transporter permease subunit [Kineosporia rhizophila]
MSVLTRLSLANRALVLLVSLAITGFGLLAIPSLKQQLLPSLEFPAAFVTATYSGAAPDTVESQLVEPLEGAVRGVPGVTGVVSTASEGFATVQVELEYGTNIDQASNRMQTAITRISSQLPDGADPQVLAGSTDDFLPAVLLSASGGDTTALADKLEQLVVPEINEIDGVRTAEVTGAPDRQVVITPDPAKMAKAKVDAQAITTALSSAGTAVPAGSVADGTQSLTVQVGGAISTIEQLRKVFVGAVPLESIASVESVDVPPTSLTRTDGQNSLGISVTSTPDGNPVDISHAIQDNLDEWKAALGQDAQLVTVFDQAPFIEQSVESLATEGVLGLVMAVIVILVFLTSIRSTLVTAVSIPLSVLAALIVMWVDGISLNVLSLGGLTIAIGRVVDDSIVVLENIKRHLEYGEEKIHAITTAVREVAGAITASTITTVAVFLPLTLVGGIIGELFQPFGITVSVALLASLLVSLTIVPVLAFWFLKQPSAEQLEHADEIRVAAEEKERKSFLQRMYVPVIHFAVDKRWTRWTTVGVSVVILAATLAMVPLLKTNFLDQSGQNTINVTQTLPAGTSLQTTDAAAKKVEQVLSQEGELESYQATVGGGAIPGLGGNANSATFSLTVNEDAEIEEVTTRLEDRIGALKDVGDVVVGGAQGGFGASDIQVQVQAGDAEVLSQASEQVREAVAEVTELKDVTSDLSEEIPRVEVEVDPEAAAAAGLTEQAVGGLVSNAFRGSQAGQVTIDGVQQNIVISSGTEAPATIADVRKIQIPTAQGPVRLSEIAVVREQPGPVQVTRIDGARSATVSGTPTNPDNLGAATSSVTEKLDALELPAGASYTIGGASAEQEEAFGQLGLALLAAIVIVFVVMVATFRSLVQPLVLLVSIPFAATGAIILLLLTNTPLGVAALIGMLMLVGIVVTNAIVLIDLVNQYRREGMPLQQAVVEGGRHRLRPILMTALATIFALLPMAVGLTGHGGFISQPLAVVVIGGLTSATVLTLVLVPSLYTLVEGGKEKRAAKRAAKKAKKAGNDQDPAPAEPVTAGHA